MPFNPPEFDMERIQELAPRVELELRDNPNYEWFDGADDDEYAGRVDLLADLMLHMSRVMGEHVDANRATAVAANNILAVLDRLDIDPNDLEACAYVGAAIAVMSDDRELLLQRAHTHWLGDKEGDDMTEPLTPDLFLKGLDNG